MKQLTVQDVLDFLGEVDQSWEAPTEDVRVDEVPTEEEGTLMPKPNAVIYSIDDVVLNTLQGEAPITNDVADVLTKLTEIRHRYAAICRTNS